MKKRLILYINDQYLAERDLSPPECKGVEFEQKEKIRDWYLQNEIAEMKRKYLGALQKVDWEIVMVVEWDLEND